MDLENRISLLAELGEFMGSDHPSWTSAKTRAFQHNAWFIPDFINLSIRQIVSRYLRRDSLENWVRSYDFPAETQYPVQVGIVMAGNIPLVGFHDFLCCFL